MNSIPKYRYNVLFLDGTQDSAIGVSVNLRDGMMIVDCGPDQGEMGYNIRAIKSWFSEPTGENIELPVTTERAFAPRRTPLR